MDTMGKTCNWSVRPADGPGWGCGCVCVSGSRSQKGGTWGSLGAQSLNFQGMSSTDCRGGPGLGLASRALSHDPPYTCTHGHRHTALRGGRQGDLLLLPPVHVPAAALSLLGRCPSLTLDD